MYNIWLCEYYGTIENDNCSLCYNKILYEDIKKEELEDYAKFICDEYKCNFSCIILNKYVKLNNNIFENDKYCLFMEELVD